MISHKSLNHSKIISQSPKTITSGDPVGEGSDMVTITPTDQSRWAWQWSCGEERQNQHQELNRQTGEEFTQKRDRTSLKSGSIFQHKHKSSGMWIEEEDEGCGLVSGVPALPRPVVEMEGWGWVWVDVRLVGWGSKCSSVTFKPVPRHSCNSIRSVSDSKKHEFAPQFEWSKICRS